MGQFVLLLLIAFATSVDAANSTSQPWLDHRLPRTLYPIQYDLFLHIGAQNKTFDGAVTIHVAVLSKTKYIILRSSSMDIRDLRIFVNKTTELQLNESFWHDPYYYLVLKTEQLLTKGSTIKMNMTFTANHYFGFGVIRDRYRDAETNEIVPLKMTAFKPAMATAVFPCFDEPYYKSRFRLTIRHMANHTAVSNMPAEIVKNVDSQWTETRFKKTPNISTSSLGFVISDFVFKNNTLPDGKPHRVWVRRGREDLVDYAMNATRIIQGYLSRELENIRSVEKIDQFDLPYTLYGRVQSQLGLLFHKGGPLIFNASNELVASRPKHLVALATGLTGIYFGNIVSCRFWQHVWLDSALADFYARKAADTIESIAMDEQELKETALATDAGNISHPLVRPPTNVTNIDHVLSAHATIKGSALLKMLENILGPDNFKRGIRRYLRMNSQKTVSTQDLWSALQLSLQREDSSMNVSEIMKTWVYSAGYPVINIRVLPDNKINITQKRFLLDPLGDPNKPPSKHGYKWHVPINYKTEGGTAGRFWLNRTTALIFENPMGANDKWLLLNSNQAGYFRVNYDDALWDKIMKALAINHEVFTELQRAQLLSDAVAVAEANQLRYDTVLNLTTYASAERFPLAWTNIHAAFKILINMFWNTTDIERLKKYALDLATPLMNELGVTDEGTDRQRRLRPTVMELSCFAGHRGCIENSTRLFKAWIESDTLNSIPINIRQVVYCNGLAHSDSESEWNTTFHRFLALSPRSEERANLMAGLACTRNLTLKNRFLEWYISNSTGNSEIWSIELYAGIEVFRTNPAANSHFWNWAKNNYQQIEKRFGAGETLILVYSASRVYNTETQLPEVIGFMDRFNATDCLDKTIKIKVVEQIRANIRWIENHSETVSRWLQQRVST